MKKYLLVIALWTMMSFPSFAQHIYSGDVNHDGKITIADVEQLVRIVLEQEEAELILIRDGKVSFQKGEPVTSITLDQASYTLGVGDSFVLSATVLPESATDKRVVWVSSDASVATVEDGLVTAVGEGQVLIKAVAADGSGVFGVCEVSVIPAGGDPGGSAGNIGWG